MDYVVLQSERESDVRYMLSGTYRTNTKRNLIERVAQFYGATHLLQQSTTLRQGNPHVIKKTKQKRCLTFKPVAEDILDPKAMERVKTTWKNQRARSKL